MNIHRLKCWLGLHDWEPSLQRYDDVVVVEKRCLWCGAETTAVSYPAEADDAVERSSRTH